MPVSSLHPRYDIGAIAVYPIGVPLALFLALYKNRARLYSDWSLHISMGFLSEAYRVDMWYFELFDMVRPL